MTLPLLDRWQFRVSRTPVPDARPVGDLWLEAGEDLPVTTLLDDSGRDCGVILGFLIDPVRRSIPGASWQAPAVFDPAAPERFALTALRALAGRFLLIIAAGGGVRIYPDVAAQLPCVFDRESGKAGSTAYALLDDKAYEDRLDRVLFDRLGVNGEGWFPAGLTAHRGIERLLPGHVLELEQGRISRFWPLAAIPPCADPQAVVGEVIDLVRAQTEALLTGDKRVTFALTGGKDTRVLLACARPYLDRISFVTVTGGDRHHNDTVIARMIAERFGLDHIDLPRIQATPEQRERFIRRGGHCNGDSNAGFHPSVWPIARDHVFVGGLGGEYAMGFFWHAGDTADMRVSEEILARRFGLRNTPELRAALQSWLDGLPGMDAFGILDLAYNENRMGPWAAVQFYSDPGLVRQAPLLTWRGVELMFSLPPEWKRDRRMHKEIIERLWPELVEIPTDIMSRRRRLIGKLRRVLADPRNVAKKLRKLRR